MLDGVHPRPRKQHSRRRLLHAFAMMAGTGYFELATGLIRWIAVLRLLGPTGRGLIGLVQVAERYLANIHLGVLHGITKRLPQALGRSDEEAAQRIEDVGVTWIMLASAVGAVGMLLAGLLWPGLEPLTRLVVCIGASIYMCDQTYNLYRTIGRSWQVYQPLVAGSVVLSLGLTSLMVGGAWIGHTLGATFGWLLASAGAVMALHWTTGLRVRVRVHWPTVRELIAAGIPLTAMAFGDMLLLTLDGTLLLRLNATVLGLYMGVAMQTRRFLFNLARAITFVLTPHLLERHARENEIEKLRASVLRAAHAAALGVPTMALATALLLPPAVRTLVPKFYEAVPAGQVTSFVSCLMIVSLTFGAALIALDREWFSVAGQLLGAAVIAAAAWAPAGRGDLFGVAVGSSVGTWVAAMAVSAAALRHMGLGFVRVMYELVCLQLPLAWAVAAFFIAERAAAVVAAPAADSWPGALLRLAVAMALAGPMAIVAEKRYRFLARWRKRYRSAEDQK